MKMKKIYIVRLSDEEMAILKETIKTQKGGWEKARRARILLKADINGPNWTDVKIAEAFDCRTKTVENIRQRLVKEGFEAALQRKKRKEPPTPKLLDGAQEAKIIALRLGNPPDGYGNWTLRLLRDHIVELGIVDSISHETIRQTLKKTNSQTERSSTG